jgi:hypothetical protein
MTDENDIKSEKADSGRTNSEKQDASIIATSGPADDPDVYLVEYPDGEQVYEPATPTNIALFEDDLYVHVQGYTDLGHVDGAHVELDADIENRDYEVTVDGQSIPIPDDQVKQVIRAFQTGSPGSHLLDLYDSILDGQVRRNTIEQFESRFPSDRIQQTAKGWIVDDTYLVTYEAENYVTTVDTVYERKSDDMVEVDGSKPGVDLTLNIDGETTVPTPDGETVTVDEKEQRFLATVECLLFPEDYLGAKLVDEIEQTKAADFDDTIEDIADSASVGGYTDNVTGNWHRHGFDKHRAISEAAAGTLDASLGMTEEAIDKLYFNDYDHAAPHELLARREEFENAPFDIFEDEDAGNSDFNRWKAIEKAKDSAPINDEHHRKIRSMFADDQTSLNSF